MSKVSIQGDQNGTGNFTIKAPNSNSDRTLTIPDSDGELLYTDSNGDFSVDGDTFYVDSANNRVGVGTTSPEAGVQIGDKTGSQSLYIWGSNGNANSGILAFAAQSSYSSEFVQFRYDSDGNILFIETDTGFGVGELAKFDRVNGNFSFNSGYGSVATAYGCRAWVNFDGTGTVSIRESGNVSSITDNGTGDYTVNFTTAMPDLNYSFSTGASRRVSATATGNQVILDHSTSFLRIKTRTDSFDAGDANDIVASVFR